MSALDALEREFQQYVYRRGPGMEARVADTGKLGTRERLDIYADAYRLRLLEVLENDFPGLKALAGVEQFLALGRDYIESHPSPHFNIRWYNEALPEFLREAAPWRDIPSLAEMAALEWAMSLAFDAPDEPVASAAEVARLTPDQWAQMQPVPLSALRRLNLEWNVAQVRQSVDRKTDVPAAQRLAQAQPWVVWRRDFTVYYRELETDEAWAFDQAREEANFGLLCEGLCEWHQPDAVAARAAAMLRRWLEDGLIQSVRT